MSHVPTWIWVLLGIVLVLVILYLVGVRIDVGTSNVNKADWPCMACW